VGDEPDLTPRQELQDILESITGNVYFQPPATFQMKYPCIVYALDDMNTKFADNVPYAIDKRYQVTVIDRNPDTAIPDAVALLAKCRFDRYFPNEGLNNYVFQLYY